MRTGALGSRASAWANHGPKGGCPRTLARGRMAAGSRTGAQDDQIAHLANEAVRKAVGDAGALGIGADDTLALLLLAGSVAGRFRPGIVEAPRWLRYGLSAASG